MDNAIVNFLKQDNDFWVTIEIVRGCNIECKECTQAASMFKKYFMKASYFKKILSMFHKEGVKFKTLTPFFRGEPLENPEFDIICQYISEYRNIAFKNITLHTNTFHLDKYTDSILKYLNSPFDELTFSVDAVTQKTTNKIRKNLNIKKCFKNIHLFLKQRKHLPFVIFQFIVRPENYFEAFKFIKIIKGMFKELSLPSPRVVFDIPEKPLKNDIIYFRKLLPPPKNRDFSEHRYKQAELLHQRLKKEITSYYSMNTVELYYRRSFSKISENKRVCRHIFCGPVISADGYITICCNDLEFELKLSHKIDKGFLKQWANDFLLKKRILHIKNKVQAKKCQSCYKTGGNLKCSDVFIAQYLNMNGMFELIDEYAVKVIGNGC